MPRGAKGQRDLMAKIMEMAAANPGITAADLAKKAEERLIAEGIAKPSAELPADLKVEAEKVREWCATNKKKVLITKDAVNVKSVRPKDPNAPAKPRKPKAEKAAKA